MCVCVWADCHFVSGEPSYDEFHARDGETKSVIGICSDKCDIGTQDFTLHVIISVNDIIALYFLF